MDNYIEKNIENETKEIILDLNKTSFKKIKIEGDKVIEEDRPIETPFGAKRISIVPLRNNEKGIFRLQVVGYREFEIDRMVDIRIILPEEMNNYQEEIPEEIVERLNKNPDWPYHYRTYARLIHKHGTLPRLIKDTIREHITITDGELQKIIEGQGYRPGSGSIGATIKVLQIVTREIRIEGYRAARKYIWVGKNKMEE